MPLNRGAEVFSPIVIVGVLVGVIWVGTAGQPEVRARLPWFFAAGLVFMFVMVALGHVRDRRRYGAIQSTLDRLLALRHERGDAAALEAEALYAELRNPYLRTHIERSEDFIAATRAAGPHQLACLRLTIQHAWTGEEPWCGILREHEELLEAAELSPTERKRLKQLLSSPSSE